MLRFFVFDGSFISFFVSDWLYKWYDKAHEPMTHNCDTKVSDCANTGFPHKPTPRPKKGGWRKTSKFFTLPLINRFFMQNFSKLKISLRQATFMSQRKRTCLH